VLHLSVQKCGTTAPETLKIPNFTHKFAYKGRIICTISTELSAFVFNLVTFGGQATKLYVFAVDGGISPQIFNTAWGKSTDRILKS